MGFCPSGVLSQWGFVPVGFCPVGFCPSGVLSQWGFVLHSQQRLEQVQSAKYLGISITDNLDWGQHVSELSCKATKTVGFLWRNLALAPRHTKEVAYKTLV